MSFISSTLKNHHKNDSIVHSEVIDNSENSKEDKKSDISSFSILDNQSISNEEFSCPSTITESPLSSSSELDQSYILSSNPTLIQYFWYYYYQSKLFLRRLFASSSTRTLISLIAIPFISGFITALIRHRHRISAHKH